MFFPTYVALSACVLLASHASVLSIDTDNADPTTTLKGLSFAARATPNADKGSSNNHSLLNEANMEYTGKVNVGGHDFTLLIDTGSSDLWVTCGRKLDLNSTTNTTVNLTYGIGSASGNIAYAPVSFAGFYIDNQGFLNVCKTSQQGAEGILGLGLDGLSALERTTKNTSTRSVMANIFAQHPYTPHLIGLALERSDDGEDTAGGYLTIGEYDPQFSNVIYTPKIPVTPTSTSRWTIALDAMTVNGKSYMLKSNVQGTKKGQAIALIDSGTSLAYIPTDAVDAIYSQYNGAVHVKTSNQDAWFVPCMGQVNLTFTFANITYAINPLELSSPMRVVNQNNQYTVCVNSFRPPLDGKEHDYDFLLGDIFMRNVYSVFNFGNVSVSSSSRGSKRFTEPNIFAERDAKPGVDTANEQLIDVDTDPNVSVHIDAKSRVAANDAKDASIQLLSRTNPGQAYADFQGHRKYTLETWPPLFDLSKLHTNGTIEGGGRLDPPADN